MLLPNRHGSSDKYRYGFNGMEKDDEIKGLGNSYDFGARMYDSRIGRWFATDALESKNTSFSTYIYVNNNPIIYIDPDGKDAIIRIKGNTITISTILFVYGSGVTDERIAQMKDDITKVWGADHTYKDPETGKVYNVRFDVDIQKYGQDNPLSIPELYTEEGKGNNYVEIRDEAGRSFVDSKNAKRKNNKKDGFKHKNSKTGVWFTNDRHGRPKNVAHHELGHLFGLSDRYNDIYFDYGTEQEQLYGSEPHPGFENTIMASSSLVQPNQLNIDAIVKHAVEGYNASFTKTWNACKFCPGEMNYEFIKDYNTDETEGGKGIIDYWESNTAKSQNIQSLDEVVLPNKK